MCTDAVRGIESVQGANCFKVEHRGKILYHEYGSSGISGLRHGVPQLVSGDPELHGRPLVQRLHRGLQQQNEGPQARLLRDAELPELQKSDPFLQRCTEKTAPGLSTPTRSWMIVFFASTPTIDIEPDKCRSCRQGKAARLSRSAAQSTFRSAKSSWNSACQKVPEGFP